jgi:hypothetical protein
MNRASVFRGACLVLSLISLWSIKGWSQQPPQTPSTALQAKSVDAASMLAQAAQGRVRIVVQYQPPLSPARLAMGTPQEDIQAITAENEGIQNSILESHFGAISDLTGPERGLTRMSISPAFAINASASEIESLANDSRVVTIELDRQMRPRLIQSVPLIGMNTAFGNGATGSGWAVAVVDSGFETNHTFITLQGASERASVRRRVISAAQNKPGRLIGFPSTNRELIWG